MNRDFCLWKNKNIEHKWFRLKRYYSLNASIYEMEPHTHTELEIMYVTYGKCEVTCIDSRGNTITYIMKKEDYIIIDSGVFHSLNVERDGFCRILNIEILLEEAVSGLRIGNFTAESPVLRTFLDREDDFSFMSDKNNEMLFLIQNIQYYDSSITDKAEGSLAQNLYLAQFLILLARQAETRGKTSRGNRYVKKVKEYLEQNYENDIHISDIANLFGISDAYLQRTYKQTEGESIIRSLHRIRMEKASVLLTNSNLPIVDIAISVGINSRQHFTRVFYEEYGCSPKDYRKMKGNSEVNEGFETFFSAESSPKESL